ncbi:immune inhibitor A [Paraclostridium bifermentans]|nr:immune inhibitor A [Paraclostridium bifermentans]
MVKPFSGENVYWGGKGKDGESLHNSMTAEINLNNTNNPQLKFKTLYDIEKGWDFASIQVREKGSKGLEFYPR